MDELADIRVATVEFLAAHAVHVHAVLVFEIDAEIIVLVSRSRDAGGCRKPSRQ